MRWSDFNGCGLMPFVPDRQPSMVEPIERMKMSVVKGYDYFSTNRNLELVTYRLDKNRKRLIAFVSYR
jgi:hypothetical protein